MTQSNNRLAYFIFYNNYYPTYFTKKQANILKNIITQAQDLLLNAFKNLPSNFPTSIPDKILESKEEKQLEIVPKMKSKNIPIAEIQDLTGLSKEEIVYL